MNSNLDYEAIKTIAQVTIYTDHLWLTSFK